MDRPAMPPPTMMTCIVSSDLALRIEKRGLVERGF